LIEQGVTVVGLDDLSGGYIENVPIHERMLFRRIDLNDYDKVTSVFQEFRPSVTYHLAAYAAEGLSPFIRRFNYTNNIVASASVINCCIEFDSKLVFASSMAVYGNQRPPFVETMPLVPADPYGVAKAAIESDLRCAQEQHGLRWSVVRPHNVIGVRQNIWDRYRNVAGIFIRKALEGEPLTVFGDGSQRRAFTDVRGLLAPLWRLAADGDGSVFNLGSDVSYSLTELAGCMTKVANENGIEVSTEYLDARHEVHEALCDHSRAARDLGFADKTDLEDVLREMFTWAITQPRRSVKNMDYEISKGLYSSWEPTKPS
jgi:UDP-glucose 4-epimerase